MTSSLAVVWALLGPVTQGPADTGIRATLLASLATAHATVTSLRVVTRMPLEGVGEPPGHYLHADLRFLGANAYGLDFSHGTADTPWQDYYVRSQTYVVDGHAVAVWPGMRAFERFEIDHVPMRIALLTWFNASGYWPAGAKMAAPRGFDMSLSLLDVLADPRYVPVPPADGAGGSVVMHEAQCCLLELPGADRLWLDLDHHAIRRREWWVAGTLRLAIDVDRLTEVGRGLWLPAAATLSIYEGDKPTAEPAVRHRLVVEVTEANAVVSSDLEYVPEPGALLMDRSVAGEFRQVVPGGLDVLEAIGADLAVQFAHRESDTGFAWRATLGFAMVAVLLAWFAGGRRDAAAATSAEAV